MARESPQDAVERLFRQNAIHKFPPILAETESRLRVTESELRETIGCHIKDFVDFTSEIDGLESMARKLGSGVGSLEVDGSAIGTIEDPVLAGSNSGLVEASYLRVLVDSHEKIWDCLESGELVEAACHLLRSQQSQAKLQETHGESGGDLLDAISQHKMLTKTILSECSKAVSEEHLQALTLLDPDVDVFSAALETSHASFDTLADTLLHLELLFCYPKTRILDVRTSAHPLEKYTSFDLPGHVCLPRVSVEVLKDRIHAWMEAQVAPVIDSELDELSNRELLSRILRTFGGDRRWSSVFGKCDLYQRFVSKKLLSKAIAVLDREFDTLIRSLRESSADCLQHWKYRAMAFVHDVTQVVFPFPTEGLDVVFGADQERLKGYYQSSLPWGDILVEMKNKVDAVCAGQRSGKRGGRVGQGTKDLVNIVTFLKDEYPGVKEGFGLNDLESPAPSLEGVADDARDMWKKAVVTLLSESVKPSVSLEESRPSPSVAEILFISSSVRQHHPEHAPSMLTIYEAILSHYPRESKGQGWLDLWVYDKALRHSTSDYVGDVARLLACAKTRQSVSKTLGIDPVDAKVMEAAIKAKAGDWVRRFGLWLLPSAVEGSGGKGRTHGVVPVRRMQKRRFARARSERRDDDDDAAGVGPGRASRSPDLVGRERQELARRLVGVVEEPLLQRWIGVL